MMERSRVMLNPMTTGLQVASHDAWLAEMRKEPSPELGRVAQPEAEAHRRQKLASQLAEVEELEAETQSRKGLLSRLAGVAKRLWPQRWPSASTVPESPAHAKGAGV
jgi:hypothetical protein